MRVFRDKKFYVGEDFIPILQEFDSICDREGTTRSDKIREFIMRYVMVHSEGNPQMLLEKFMSELPTSECYFCHGHFTVLKKVKYKSGLVAPTCEVCLEMPGQKNCVLRVLR